jgi:hypothetical protein
MLPTRPAENDEPMPDTNTPIQRGDDEANATAVETRMRSALGRLGPQAPSSPGGPGSRAGAAQTGPQRRSRFARDGEVVVEHVPAPNRTASDAQRELAAERAARQAAEQALTVAKAVNQRRCGTQGNSSFSTQCGADQR